MDYFKEFGTPENVDLEALDKFRREGSVSRYCYGACRGTYSEAAQARLRPSELTLLEEIIAKNLSEEVKSVAAGALGEYGGHDQIVYLSAIMHDDINTITLRRACSDGISSIGGPQAIDVLTETVKEKTENLLVRKAALCGILEIVTGDWDTYLMGGRRMALPSRIDNLFLDLKKDSELADSIDDALYAFDYGGG